MDWLWILGLAGLMLVMHRFGMGCCGGHAHGGGKGEGDHGGKPEEAPDKAKRTAV